MPPDHGLVLSEKGRLYDSKKGEALPDGEAPMPLLTDDELKQFPEPSSMQVVGGYVRRYLDMVAISDKAAGDGDWREAASFATSRDSRVNFFSRRQCGRQNRKATTSHRCWCRSRVIGASNGKAVAATLAPGDTLSVPENLPHSFVPSMTGEAAIYQVLGTDDPAGSTWKPN